MLELMENYMVDLQQQKNINEITKIVKDGVSKTEIAKKLGIGRTSLRRIINTKDI